MTKKLMNNDQEQNTQASGKKDHKAPPSFAIHPSLKAPELATPHFHANDQFDFDKFHHSAQGLASAFFRRGAAELTMVFRSTDDNGKDYFQYRFPEEWTREASPLLKAALTFLSTKRIPIFDAEGEKHSVFRDAFSVNHMYCEFRRLQVGEGKLAHESLRDYFGENNPPADLKQKL
ncbi:MAG: hypothetical protein NWR72_16215, partial [Bacteroidia bacterium]|nr:hypothetical protein [Bacteroidia bacterium]